MRREFLQSPHHAVMALATLGAGFASGEALYFILGAAAYVLGWVFVPDMPLFKNWVEGRQNMKRAAEAQGELAEFAARRDTLLGELTNARRRYYDELSNVCREIEHSAAGQTDDPRVFKLEELMWTFLRLLTIEQSLDQFLETEAREDVPGLLAAAKSEVDDLVAAVEALRRENRVSALEAKERLLESRRELVATLEKRADRHRAGKEQSRTGGFRAGAARPADQTHPRRFHCDEKCLRAQRTPRRDCGESRSDEPVAVADGSIPRYPHRHAAERRPRRIRRARIPHRPPLPQKGKERA